MKNLYKLILVCLLFVPVMAFSQVRGYTTSVYNTFLGGNNGGWYGQNGNGGGAPDDAVTFDATDGIMKVAVNLVQSPWSVIWDFMGNCWVTSMVFNQTNRFIEMRVQCDAPITTPISINTWGGCAECCGDMAKSWPGNTFTIPTANTWTIIFLRVPQTKGGAQNILDTIFNGPAISLPNGNFQFNYFMMGDAAKPPTPVIGKVSNKIVCENAGQQSVSLSGIQIPGRTLDGLKISAAALSDGILQDVSMVDLGNGPLSPTLANPNIATADLQFSPVVGMGGQGDSIIITLNDTIRGTTVTSSFYVTLIAATPTTCAAGGNALADNSDGISIWPTNVVDNVNIAMQTAVTGNITVVNMYGKTVASKNIVEATTATLDLSADASGMYIIKISDGKETFTKKVVKQ